jgi:glucose/arabinose dehydrogenase
MNYSRLKTSAFLALSLSVSACSQWGAAPPKAASPPSPPPSTAQAEEARPAAKPVPPVKSLRPEPRPAEELAALPQAPLPPRLVGLSEKETVDLLGQPVEESATPPGKTWLYKANGCQLSVHLFPDMERGGFYTLDFTSAEGAKEACLGKVVGQQARAKRG